jgi:iron complex outermembrane receptor protein
MTFSRSRLQLAVLAAISTQVHASDLGPGPDAVGAPVHEIGTVTIVGSHPSSLPTSIPTTIEGIGRAELDRSVNASDAEDALKYLPSLLVRKRYIGDYNHAVLSTRASGTGNSARSMVYADGILLSNYLGNGATFAPRWGMVPPEQIERVDVLYGPFSAAYGGNSVGAVVDYVTRMPTKFEAHARVGLSHQAYSLYRTHKGYGAEQGSLGFGNRVGRWAWTIDVGRTASDGQPLTFPSRLTASGKPDGSGIPVSGALAGRDRANNPILLFGTATAYHTVQDNLRARLAYDVTPTLRATYTFGMWRNDADGRSETWLRDGQGHPVYSGSVMVDGRSYALGPADFPASHETMRHVMHGLALKSHTHGVFDWELASSRYDYATDELRAPTTPFPSAAAGGKGRIVDGHGTGWRTYSAKGIWRPDGKAGAHLVEFGAQRESYRLASVENATPDWIGGAAAGRNQAFSGRTSIDSLYLQDTWRFSERWKAVLGLREEHWQARDGETSNAVTTVYQGSRSESHLSPKAALAYQANEDWVLKASVGRAVRFPTVSELYQGGINASGVLSNNDPQLKPEKSWTGELSAERRLKNGSWRVTMFGERTADALYAQTNVLASPAVTNIQNVDRIVTRGLESAWTNEDVFVPGLSLNASVTWTRSRIERNDKFPASVGKWQPRVPDWRATGVASYAATDKLDLTLAARYSGRQYSTLDNSDPNGFAYQGTSKYFTVDMRARYRIDKQWSVALGIENLNNYKYWNFHPYPQRSFVGELRFDM